MMNRTAKILKAIAAKIRPGQRRTIPLNQVKGITAYAALHRLHRGGELLDCSIGLHFIGRGRERTAVLVRTAKPTSELTRSVRQDLEQAWNRLLSLPLLSSGSGQDSTRMIRSMRGEI